MKKINRTFSFLILGIVGIFSLLTNISGVSANAVQRVAAPSTQDFESFFDSALQEQMAAEHISGATVSVVQNGVLAFTKGYGYADLEASIPVQADETLFFIGSNGKLFTWTAVMQLAEQSKLDLHADVNTYLDFEIPATFAEPITLHHLMTHTAGFEDDFNSLFVSSTDQLLPLREHLIRYMPDRVYAPGAVSAYSNYGTALAGYIVEQVSGQPFDTFLTQNILEPLGMDHSFAGNTIPDELRSGVSKGYKFQNGVYNSIDFEWTAASPCAPIRSTATDLAKFMLVHLNNGCAGEACILRPETVALMHGSQFTHHPQMTGMAYGFLDMEFNGQRLLWHMGESPRFISILALIPEQNLGLMVSYNTPPANGRTILFNFMDTFFPYERPELSEQPLPRWEERAAQFNGTYIPARSAHSNPQALARLLNAVPVTIDEGKVDISGWHFVETEPGFFRQAGGDRLLTFAENENGQIWMFIGPLAYFRAAWYQSLLFTFALLGVSFLLFLSTCLVWPIRSVRSSRRNLAHPKRSILWLSGSLGLFNFGLLTWMILVLVNFGENFAFLQSTVNIISGLFWLAVPWTMAVMFITIRAWLLRQWTSSWRIHYTLVSFAAVAFVFFIWSYHLFGKII